MNRQQWIERLKDRKGIIALNEKEMSELVRLLDISNNKRRTLEIIEVLPYARVDGYMDKWIPLISVEKIIKEM